MLRRTTHLGNTPPDHPDLSRTHDERYEWANQVADLYGFKFDHCRFSEFFLIQSPTPHFKKCPVSVDCAVYYPTAPVRARMKFIGLEYPTVLVFRRCPGTGPYRRKRARPARYARWSSILRSLVKHREGLSVFVEHPQVPMDNNLAERVLRGPVIGRRLSFGSDSEGGARFTARMYSVLGTLAANGINVLRWLEAWLGECAANGGRPPRDLSPWLPWSMSGERRRALAAPG